MAQHKPTTIDAAEAAEMLAASCLAMRLRVLGRVVAGSYDAALRPLDLTASQLTILAVLVKLGPQPQGRLAELLAIEKSTLSRNIQRMSDRGLVQEDRAQKARIRVLSISANGQRILERAYPLWKAAQDRAIAELGPDAAAAIKAMADPLIKQPDLTE